MCVFLIAAGFRKLRRYTPANPHQLNQEKKLVHFSQNKIISIGSHNNNN